MIVLSILLSIGTLTVGLALGRLAPRVAAFVMGFWGTIGFGFLIAVCSAWFTLWQASSRF
jgi:hypothetical protein